MRRRTTTTTSRRGAFTLVEILFSSAALVGVLLLAWMFTFQGFSRAAHLQRRARADALSRDLLARYAPLPFEDLERMFRGQAEIDPAENGDALLDGSPAAFERRLLFQRLGGASAGAVLRARVSWRDAGGKRRTVRHSRYLAGREGLADGLLSASGFRTEPPRKRGAGYSAPVGAGTLAAGGREFDSLVDAASGEVRGPPTSQVDVILHGDPIKARALVGAAGRFAKRYGDAKTLEKLRNDHARRSFRRRTGYGKPRLEEERIPDGTYRYHVDVLDLRDARGVGAIHGLFRLRDESGGEHRLVCVRRHRSTGHVTSLEGDEVLDALALADPRSEAAWLGRTVERIYLVTAGADPFERRLVIRTLSAKDGSRRGGRVTRREVARVLSERLLTEATGEALVPLVYRSRQDV